MLNDSTPDTDFSVYPWNQSIWDWLQSQYRESTHAWLFAGSRGLGRHQLSLTLANRILSIDKRNRDLFRAGTHPDFHVVVPEILAGDGLLSAYAQRYFDRQPTAKPKTVITVDQVRKLIQKVSTRAHSANQKVVILTPAERMNLNAANALLKLLEEPPTDTLFILISERTSLIPATVRSRTSKVSFQPPPVEAAVNWLREELGPRQEEDVELLLGMADGAPLLALAYAQAGPNAVRNQINDDVRALWQPGGDPLALAARWQELGAEQVLPWLQRLLCDLIRDAMRTDTERWFNPDVKSWVTNISKNINITKSYELYDRLGLTIIDLDGPLDKRLLLEDVALALNELLAA